MKLTWKSMLGTGVAGMVMSLGAAQVLASAGTCSPCCPPDEQDGRAVRVIRGAEPSMADVTLDFGGAGTGRVLRLAPVLSGGSEFVRAPSLSTAYVLRVDPAQRLGGTLSLALDRPGDEQPAGKGERRARAVARAASGGDGESSMVIVKDDDSVSIKMENGKITSVERNGKKVPLDRVKREGGNVKVLDEKGTAVFEFNIETDNNGGEVRVESLDAPGGGPARVRRLNGLGAGPAGELRFDTAVGGLRGARVVQGMQVEPPKVMIGIQLADPDRSLLGHFGLEAGDATLVSGVYDDLPAAKAGLEPYDIIVGVDGKEPAGQDVVRRALRETDENGTVKLTVIHRGQKHDVKIKVAKYEAEKLEKSKVKSIALGMDVFGRGGEEGGANRLFVTPGAKGFTFTTPQEWWRSDLSPEAQAQARQEMDRALKSGEQARKVVGEALKKEAARRADEQARAFAKGDMAPEGGADVDRLKGIEERMERLEKMIEKMIERHENQRGGDRAPERRS
jgi:hypothetical protein